jgi:outer membrane protein assembly factor BamB
LQKIEITNDFTTFLISCRNIFVTTLDGTLSALDIEEGTLQWSISTEPGELLSSSIHRLELTTNGKQVRMIPSLSGKKFELLSNKNM